MVPGVSKAHRQLPDNRSGKLASFVTPAEFLVDLVKGSKFYRQFKCQTYGPRQANLVLIAWRAAKVQASLLIRRLARTFAARSYKQ